MPASPAPTPVRAVFWDLGGVVFTSPFDAFARYEAEIGVPVGTIRRLNATDPDTNAWARFERNEDDVDAFCARFEAEALEAGFRLDARRVLDALEGEVRAEMVEAIRRLRGAGLRVAALTNNVQRPGRPGLGHRETVHPLFDAVIESSVVGVRKPEPRFYELACAAVGVAPTETVFLDDLGVNLKPAAAMGMRTIKVVDPAVALAELEAFVGLALR